MDTLKHMPGVIVVDLQGDFTVFKKGALAVPGTDEIFINKIRNTTEVFKKEGYPIFATQDWHPADHISFYTNHPGRKPFEVIEVENRKQALWPSHCIQGTENARLLLDEILFDAIVKKGKDRRYDSYSGFQDDGGDKTELNSLLKDQGIRELIIYGVATDYCVKATALDAIKAGYQVRVIEGLCRGVSYETTAKALEEMRSNRIALTGDL